MTILAQRFVESDNALTDTPHHKNILAALKLQEDISRTATRVVFDEDLHDVLHEMVDAKQLDFSMICKHARLPAPVMWIEWHKAKTISGVLDCGALLQQNPLMTELTCSIVAQGMGLDRSQPTLAVVCRVPQPPFTEEEMRQSKAKLLWSFNGYDGSDETLKMLQGLIAITLRVVTFALFLLQQPKITSTETVVHGEKLQRARRAKGKQELISYQRTKLRFNVLGSRLSASKETATGLATGLTTGDDARAKMRYHFCLGHYRVLHRNKPNERLIWIEGYFKGSPETGVLIREKNLKLENSA